jgi:hypothetical protein
VSGISETSAARLVAPVVDRLRGAVASRTGERLISQGVMQRYGLTPRSGQLFAMLRNTYPARSVPFASWRAVFTYLSVAETDVAVAEVQKAGLVVVEGDHVVLSDMGREAMSEFHAMSDAAAEELWGGRDVTHLLDLTDRVLAAALQEPGPTLGVMAPPYDPPGATSAGRLAERLSGLRFSRYDSHIAAWTHAGATAQTVTELPPEERAAVEVETNERAGVPYAAREPEERLELLGGLAALPG